MYYVGVLDMVGWNKMARCVWSLAIQLKFDAAAGYNVPRI